MSQNKPAIDILQENVLRFMHVTGTDRRSDVIGEFVDVELCKKLIKDEYKELMKGLDNRDLIETIDGMADLIYVINFLANKMGIPLLPFHEEVQRTNMAKAGGPKDPETGKQLKPEGWEEPDIEGILKTMRGEELSVPEVGGCPYRGCEKEDCMGWHHFIGGPTGREIQRCDSQNILADDEIATKVHDQYCGCGWADELVLMPLCSECGTSIENKDGEPKGDEVQGRLFCMSCKEKQDAGIR